MAFLHLYIGLNAYESPSHERSFATPTNSLGRGANSALIVLRDRNASELDVRVGKSPTVPQSGRVGVDREVACRGPERVARSGVSSDVKKMTLKRQRGVTAVHMNLSFVSGRE